MNPEALYAQLSELVRTMPDLEGFGDLTASQEWFGRAYVLIAVARVGQDDETAFKKASEMVQLVRGDNTAAVTIRTVIYRAATGGQKAAALAARHTRK